MMGRPSRAEAPMSNQNLKKKKKNVYIPETWIGLWPPRRLQSSSLRGSVESRRSQTSSFPVVMESGEIVGQGKVPEIMCMNQSPAFECLGILLLVLKVEGPQGVDYHQ